MPPFLSSYPKKFDRIAQSTPFGLLPVVERDFIRKKACELYFTQQELRMVSEMALDRYRWKEMPLSSEWPQNVAALDNKVRKADTLAALSRKQELLKNQAKSYRRFTPSDRPKTVKPVLKTTVRPRLGLGRCPVASEKTRCCNLLTLDAVEKCGFDCSYCSIQSFYHGNEVVFDSGFAGKLAGLKLDPDKTYHIGTGQSSDSLMWGNHQGVLEALCAFARQHPNVILELKTKSRNIGWLLKNPLPRNVLCTWSLNTQTIIDHEEHLSASLEQRLEAAGAIAEKGNLVGFHFHPIIHYHDWESGYGEICERLVRQFPVETVAMVSMGTLTFTKSVMKRIRNRELTSKILQMPMEPSAGKWSYPLEVKLDLFKGLYGGLEPWHRKVFFYLCMEPPELWSPVLGYDYATNVEFEAAMKRAYFQKIEAGASGQS